MVNNLWFLELDISIFDIGLDNIISIGIVMNSKLNTKENI